MTARLLGLILALALAVIAGACGGGESSAEGEPAATSAATTSAATSATAETTAPATTETTEAASAVDPSACDGAELTFIGLAGEEGEKELADWRSERDASIKVTNIAEWGQLIGALKVGQEYDLATIPYREAQRMIELGIFQPIDTSRLANWPQLFPGFSESSLIRGEDGQIYGVPIAWGDSPFIYAPERVPDPPTSVLDFLEPELKGRFVMFDDPTFPFYLLAIANGFTEAPLITPEQLDVVKEQAKQLVANAAAFATSYQDETDRLVAGDVDIAFDGWEAMITWAQEKGVELDYGFYEERAGGAWWDGLAIPTSATNPECALAYIDAMLAPDAQAKIAETLISGTVNADAVDVLPAAMQDLYDYSAVAEPSDTQFKSISPPEKPPAGYASHQDWLDAWQEVKAG